jgi:hypothetical protein
MATLRDAIKARLADLADLNALVGGRIFHLKVPQGTARPYIGFGRIGVSPLTKLEGPVGKVTSIVAFDIWADDADGAEAVAITLRHGFEGWRGTAALVEIGGTARRDEREEYDDDVQAFHTRQEYTILHEED